MQKDDKKMIDKNDYTAEDIDVLEGLEGVRRRPGMYIGSTTFEGLHHLVYEIVDNAIDEALAGFCTKIDVTISQENVITVSDNGRGIPVGIHPKVKKSAATVVFTELHAGGKFGGSGYKVSSGLHGVGASVVNALSKNLTLTIYKDGFEYCQHFACGEELDELTKIGPTTKTGTTVSFFADDTIFKEGIVYDFNILSKNLQERAFLNAGLALNIKDLRTNEENNFLYEGGIKTFVDYINETRDYINLLSDVIYLKTNENESENCEVEVAFTFTNSSSESMYSFANNVHTSSGGTHEDGYHKAISRVINNYARKYNFLKEKDQNYTQDDVKEGLTTVLSVKLHEAIFEGQTKSKLGSSEVAPVCNNLVQEKFTLFLEENPNQAKIICERVELAKKAREASKKARDLVKRKSTLGNVSLPGKLADCTSKERDKTEIYIVEGDSAGGSAKGGRDRTFQAILPLWGKMLNVEKVDKSKVYDNDKLDPIITALGCGVGEDCDPNNLRYNKVIIMADADVDGSHIRTLLLTFFYRYMKPVVEQGHIYIAQPPLYKIQQGKQEPKYAYTDEERDNICATITSKYSIQRYKGLGEMDSDQLWETTMNPETRIMLQVKLTDAKKADDTFDILMGEAVLPRRKFIEENAKYAQNIDV